MTEDDDPDTCDHCWKNELALVDGNYRGGSYMKQFGENILAKTKICANCASIDKQSWWRQNFYNKNKYTELRFNRVASSPVKCGGMCGKLMADFKQHTHLTHGFGICAKCFESPHFKYL